MKAVWTRLIVRFGAIKLGGSALEADVNTIWLHDGHMGEVAALSVEDTEDI